MDSADAKRENPPPYSEMAGEFRLSFILRYTRQFLLSSYQNPRQKPTNLQK